MIPPQANQRRQHNATRKTAKAELKKVTRPGLTKAAETTAGAPASAGEPADKPGISSASAADGVSGGAACPAADRSAVLPERPAVVLLPLAVFVCVILLLMVLSYIACGTPMVRVARPSVRMSRTA